LSGAVSGSKTGIRSEAIYVGGVVSAVGAIGAVGAVGAVGAIGSIVAVGSPESIRCGWRRCPRISDKGVC